MFVFVAVTTLASVRRLPSLLRKVCPEGLFRGLPRKSAQKVCPEGLPRRSVQSIARIGDSLSPVILAPARHTGENQKPEGRSGIALFHIGNYSCV